MQSKPAAGASVPAGKAGHVVPLQQPDRPDALAPYAHRPGSQPVGAADQRRPAHPTLIETSAELTAPGAYVVRWQVLAIDGHITRGDVPFTVTGH